MIQNRVGFGVEQYLALTRPGQSVPTPAASAPKPSASGSGAVGSLGQQFKSMVSSVNETQNRADSLAGQMALGDARSLHAVMIASEEASLQLSAVLQVRSKAVEAYQEVMRMQV